MYIIMQFVHGSCSVPPSPAMLSHHPSIESGEILETVVDIQEAWSQWGEIVLEVIGSHSSKNDLSSERGGGGGGGA